jgi:hypothetical protein
MQNRKLITNHLAQGWISAKLLNPVHPGKLGRFQSEKQYLAVPDRSSYIVARLRLPEHQQ